MGDWVVATQLCFIFTPKIGEDEPILTSIFFKGVGSTTIRRIFFSHFLSKEKKYNLLILGEG